MPLPGWPGCCSCGHDEHEVDAGIGWGLQDEYSLDLVPDEVLYSCHSPGSSSKPSAVAALPLARLKEEFDARAGPDGRVGSKELAEIWQACAVDRRQELGQAERAVIAIAAEHYMRHMKLSRDLRVGHCVLVAFMLGALTAPAHPGVPSLREVIKKVAKRDPEETLTRIVSEFLAVDRASTGVVKLSDVARSVPDFDCAGLGGDITLWDYVVHSLRRWTASVELIVYDLSKGVASVLGRTGACRGPRRLEALFHTSILVHGAEYWYGESIRRADDPPVSGAFGPPLDRFGRALLQPSAYVPGLRVVRLGRTFSSKTEVAYMASSMAGRRFAKGKYNAFSNNCNSFTHELSLLLTRRGIPRDVRMQSELLMSSPTVRMALPAIKLLLGEQGSQMDIVQEPLKPAAEETSRKSEEEVLGLRGLLCGFWSKDAGMSRYGVVASAWETSFDIRWFDPRTCTFSLQVGVPKGSVHSWFPADREQDNRCTGLPPKPPAGDTDGSEMDIIDV